MSDEITQADRELLAAEYERAGLIHTAKDIREDNLLHDWPEYAFRAIAAARRQGQVPGAPVGVEEMLAVAEKAWNDHQAACRITTVSGSLKKVCEALAQQPAPSPDAARPLDEWHEDNGVVTWWKLPVEEPAWIGTPLDSDWPGYHTHWTPHPAVPINAEVQEATNG